MGINWAQKDRCVQDTMGLIYHYDPRVNPKFQSTPTSHQSLRDIYEAIADSCFDRNSVPTMINVTGWNPVQSYPILSYTPRFYVNLSEYDHSNHGYTYLTRMRWKKEKESLAYSHRMQYPPLAPPPLSLSFSFSFTHKHISCTHKQVHPRLK